MIKQLLVLANGMSCQVGERYTDQIAKLSCYMTISSDQVVQEVISSGGKKVTVDSNKPALGDKYFITCRSQGERSLKYRISDRE